MSDLIGGILKALQASGVFTFAMICVGGGILLGKAYELWPQPDEHLPWVVGLTIFGSALLVAKFLAWVWPQLKARAVKSYRLRTAPHQVDTLTREELAPIAWALANGRTEVDGECLQRPYLSLVRKGFLITTDGRANDQVLRVNHRLVRVREKVIERARQEGISINRPAQPSAWAA